MYRWIAVLMLALLPLQFSWAAVAAYCGHESGDQAQHLGHHEHQHAGPTSADQDSAPADAQAGFDFDCGHCHGTCACMPAPAGGLAPLMLVSHPVTCIECTLRTLAQSPPERPQWLPLA